MIFVLIQQRQTASFSTSDWLSEDYDSSTNSGTDNNGSCTRSESDSGDDEVDGFYINYVSWSMSMDDPTFRSSCEVV